MTSTCPPSDMSNQDFIAADIEAKRKKRNKIIVGIVALSSVLLVVPSFGGSLSLLFFCMLQLAGAERKSLRLEESAYIELPSGKKVPFSIIKRTYYAFFLFPYFREYFILRNVDGKNLSPSAKLKDFSVIKGKYNIKQTDENTFLAIKNDKRILSKQYADDTDKNREAFLNRLNLLFEFDILEEIFHDDELSICRFEYCNANTVVLFQYSGNCEKQIGFLLGKDEAEKIKIDPGYASTLFLRNPKIEMNNIGFDDETLDRLFHRLVLKDKSEKLQKIIDIMDRNKFLLTPEYMLKSIGKNKKLITAIQSGNYHLIKVRCSNRSYPSSDADSGIEVFFDNGVSLNSSWCQESGNHVMDTDDYAYLLYVNDKAEYAFSAVGLYYPQQG